MLETLSEPVAQYIRASNAHDTEGMLRTFAPDALVNDIQREFCGLAAIRAWIEREIAPHGVTMQVQGVIHQPGGPVVRARIDGDFDRTGLPDPVILSFYFSVHQERITRLIILLNKPIDGV